MFWFSPLLSGGDLAQKEQETLEVLHLKWSFDLQCGEQVARKNQEKLL